MTRIVTRCSTMGGVVRSSRRSSRIVISRIAGRSAVTCRPGSNRYCRRVPRSGCLLVGVIIRCIRGCSAM